MKNRPKHIVIDARIRKSSTGRPVDRFLTYLPKIDEVNFYTILVDPSDDYESTSPNFKIKKCPYKRFTMNPLSQIGFAIFLYKLQSDVLFLTQTGLTPLLFFGKNVTFTHDLTMLRFARPGKLPSWLHKIRMIGYRLLFWKGNFFATKIIVPSNYVRDDLSDNFPFTRHKSKVIYEASEPALTQKSSPSTKAKRPFIFHVGSPLPHKNIKNLIRAFERLKDMHPDLQLVLAGKKEHYFEKLESWLADRPHRKDVLLTGFISDSELKWLYENAECYVLPSLSEGFGLPGLEAMAHKCPLVSSSATCLPEIYGEAAEYFDPYDQEAMIQTIHKVLSSSKIKQRLIKQGETQIQKYSWEKMSTEIHKLLTSV